MPQHTMHTVEEDGWVLVTDPTVEDEWVVVDVPEASPLRGSSERSSHVESDGWVMVEKE